MCAMAARDCCLLLDQTSGPHLLHFAFLWPHSIKYRDPIAFTLKYINYKHDYRIYYMIALFIELAICGNKE